MARGVSGRIVIEINPETKQELYEQLMMNNVSLKSWFLENVESFLKGRQQLTLSLATPVIPEEKVNEKRISA
ncbi:MAG: hypothetical protein BWK73_22105 [Thiothrix lacustris]|uniref:Uncharacterized protein n=1 Tax=Thiothrix lacustris TaxID=525917 RepID=A0A1Y1QN30_9GAMM|nr:hypothetical protein [Thiothrix subterranea]OQX09704.1 MAG: hypothetical protein BWK73_22105 [Thiothrix lacustris]QQZ28838.1 hypothetical protein HMY34_08780 [Thiothrix subterranea]